MTTVPPRQPFGRALGVLLGLLTLTGCSRVYNDGPRGDVASDGPVVDAPRADAPVDAPTPDGPGFHAFDLTHDSRCPRLVGYPGGFGLAWLQEDETADASLYFAVLDSQGNTKVGPLNLNPGAVTDYCPSDLLWTGTEFIVIWMHGSEYDANSNRLHAAVRPDGTVRVAPHKVSPSSSLRAAWSGSELGVIYSQGTPDRVYFRRYDADYQPLAPELLLSNATATGNAIPSGICWTGSRWVALWNRGYLRGATLKSDGTIDQSPKKAASISIGARPRCTSDTVLALGEHKFGYRERWLAGTTLDAADLSAPVGHLLLLRNRDESMDAAAVAHAGAWLVAAESNPGSGLTRIVTFDLQGTPGFGLVNAAVDGGLPDLGLQDSGLAQGLSLTDWGPGYEPSLAQSGGVALLAFHSRRSPEGTYLIRLVRLP